MKNNEEFDHILEECLERLVAGGDKIADCLSSYPQYADSLKPLLEMAAATRVAVDIQPRPEFKARARYQFHAALQEAASRRKRSLFRLRWRWAPVVAALILLLAGGGMVAAASNSMPDEPLYHIKLAVEQLQLRLTPSALGKATLYAELSDRRVEEIISLAQKDNAHLIEEVTQRLDNQLTMLVSLAITRQTVSGVMEKELPAAAPDAAGMDSQTFSSQDGNGDELVNLLQQYADSHPESLRNALLSASEEVKSALLEAIEVTSAGYEKAIMAITN